MLRADGKLCQAEWRCPHAGGAVDPSALPEGHREALRRAAALCGAEEGELATCPGHYTRKPEAFRAVTSLRWLRAGALHLRNPHPTMAEVEAIDLAQDSLAARERDELERARRKTREGGDHGQGTR
mgnify:CR=1 FL=1